MEPVTLLTTAIALATPYLIKTGEKVAEEVGAEIWKILKKPFSKDDETLKLEFGKADRREIEAIILKKITSDKTFRLELEQAVKSGQNAITKYNQQNIQNHGQIGKQVNVQNVEGDVNL